MPNSSNDLPVDIPRMGRQNFILVDVSSESGPTVTQGPTFTCHTGIYGLESNYDIVYESDDVIIRAMIDTTGDVIFSAEAGSDYEPTDSISTVSGSISIVSMGSDAWQSGVGRHEILIVLNGTSVGFPSPLNVHMISNNVHGKEIKLLATDTWSPIDKSTSTEHYSTKDICHVGTSDVYFTRTDSEDSDSTDDDYIFKGTPNVPESLVTVAIHKEDGLSILPIVVSDTRKYTDQENCICVIPNSGGSSQAKMRPGAAKLINIDSSDSDNWFNINIGNGDVLSLPSSGYNYEQDKKSDPTYATCPYRDSFTGECASPTGCVYDYENGISFTRSTWKLKDSGQVVATAPGLTNEDENPPCSGWSSGAVIHCEPSFLYSDNNGSSLYEYKATLWLSRYTKSKDGKCTEYLVEEHTYYQKRSVYSKGFSRWTGSNGYGQSNAYKEASPGIITKNGNNVYNTGFRLAPLNPSTDVRKQINDRFGVGLMCVPPSWNHLDMAVVAKTKSGAHGCASTIGGGYCLPLEYGGSVNGAYLHAYNKLTRYMTPFESQPLVGTASLSGSSITPGSNNQICMSFYYMFDGKQRGRVIDNSSGTIQASGANIPSGIGTGLSYDDVYEKISADIKVDASSSEDNGSSDMELNLYYSDTANTCDASPSCIFGYGTHGPFSGGIKYHINEYSVVNDRSTDSYEVEPYDCVESDSSDSSSTQGGLKIPLKEGTKIKVVLSYTFGYYGYEELGGDECTPHSEITATATLTFYESFDRFELKSLDTISMSGDLIYDKDMNTEVFMYAEINSSNTSSATFVIFFSSVFGILSDTAAKNCGFSGAEILYPVDIRSHAINCTVSSDSSGNRYIELTKTSTGVEALDVYAYEAEGKCTISLVSGGGGGSDSGGGESECKECRYKILKQSDSTTGHSYDFDLDSKDYIIRPFNTTEDICLSYVYPFEGPDISGNKYRSIMYAHHTQLSGGSMALGDPIDKLELTFDNKSSNMMVGSYSDVAECVGVPNGRYICDKPSAVAANLDNTYSFNLSYGSSNSDDSSSSSSSSDDATWYPDGSFIALDIEQSRIHSQTIEEGDTTITSVDKSRSRYIYIDVLDFSQVYENSSSNDSITMPEAVKLNNIDNMYIVHRSVKGYVYSDTRIEIQASRISVKSALDKIKDLTDTYKSKSVNIVKNEYSLSCPTYKAIGKSVEVLCTYLSGPPADDDIKSWALNGIPNHFYTQLGSGLKPPTDGFSDILTASVTDSIYNNSRYVVTRYRK